MNGKIRGAWAEINLDALRSNISEVKKQIGDKEIIAVIKADGYGHGASKIYRELIGCGIEKFAVASLSEAIELRNAGLCKSIMTLGYTPVEFYDEVVKYDIEQTIFSYSDAKLLSEAAVRNNKTALIQIAVDTGMRRIGFQATREEAKEVHKISKLPSVKITGLFTHFATADEKDKTYMNFQLEEFSKFNQYLEELGVFIEFKHVSNSATIIDMPNMKFDAVRSGIIIYGCYPSDEVDKAAVNLKPVMRLVAKIVHIKTIPSGEPISYGRTFITSRETRLATIAIGYADGISRLQAGKEKVLINGRFAPIVGRICMDQCMIDITDIDGVEKGDEVIIIGEDEFGNRITADDLAKNIGTINYEILCDIGRRIPRIYKKDEKIVDVKNYIR